MAQASARLLIIQIVISGEFFDSSKMIFFSLVLVIYCMNLNKHHAQTNTPEPFDLNRIIEMAWEDRTPFEAIETLYGLSESRVIVLMRRNLSTRGFKNWRSRVSGRVTKHAQKRHKDVDRGYCATQYKAPQFRQNRQKN